MLYNRAVFISAFIVQYYSAAKIMFFIYSTNQIYDGGDEYEERNRINRQNPTT